VLCNKMNYTMFHDLIMKGKKRKEKKAIQAICWFKPTCCWWKTL